MIIPIEVKTEGEAGRLVAKVLQAERPHAKVRSSSTNSRRILTAL
ncbi:hypothetical protein [Amycolatopsis sp. GM8]|nr:hypothetical protein [Amycolatopsis sp. GM8]